MRGGAGEGAWGCSGKLCAHPAEEDVRADHEGQDEERVVQAEAFGELDDPDDATCDDEHNLDVEKPAHEDGQIALKDHRKELGEDFRLHNHLGAARERRVECEGDRQHHLVRPGLRLVRLDANELHLARVDDVGDVRSYRDREGDDQIHQPSRSAPIILERPNAVARDTDWAEDDGEHGAEHREPRPALHRPRNFRLVDKLVVENVGHELDALERRQDRRRRERERRKVDQREDDEDDHPPHPELTFMRF